LLLEGYEDRANQNAFNYDWIVLCLPSWWCHHFVHVDLVELDIKFLRVIEKDHLDNILVGLILIFIGIAIDRAVDMAQAIGHPRQIHSGP
jgi:hypothetical protein